MAILARGSEPLEVRRGLPGMEDDSQSRYLEAAVHGVLVACLYLPNGNPQPGPKFDYKLRWFECLIKHAKGLYASGHPTLLAGDFNVVPTDLDIYNPAHGSRMRCCSPSRVRATSSCWTRAGSMPFATCTPTSACTPSGITSVITGHAMPGCASTTCCSTRTLRLT